MIPIDRQVQQIMGAFRGQPDKLMQRYKQGNDLIDLLALQQMKSDMDAVKQQMVLSQQQMPGTIKDQREQEVLAGYKEKAGRQVGDVAKNTAGLLAQRQASANANMQRQGITQQPAQTANNGGLMKMAGGGIVGFAEGRSVTSEMIKDLGITPDRWAKMSDKEKQQVMDILDAQSAVGQIGSGAEVLGGLPFFMQEFGLRTGQDLVNKFRTSNIGKALGLSEFDEETPEEAKTFSGSALEEMEDRSRMQQRRSDPNVFLEDIDAAVNVLAAKEQGAEAGPPIPEDYEALTQDQTKEARQEREEYDPTALLQSLQKQGVTPPVVPEAKPPGALPPGPNAGESESAGVAALKPTVPNIDSPSQTDIDAIVNPILERGGLGSLETREEVRNRAISETDAALDRSGLKTKKQAQLARQEQLNKERLNPEELNRDALLKGLISAAGGGNFAAVGAGIFNEEAAQDKLKQAALDKELGIENEMLQIDLDIGKLGLEGAGKAEDILSREKVAVTQIMGEMTKQQRQEALEKAKMNFEANKAGITNRLTELAADSLDRYRTATTEVNKEQIRVTFLQEQEALKTAYFQDDIQLQTLRQAANSPDADEDDIEAYEEYWNGLEVEWKQIQSLSKLLDTQEAMQPNQFGPVQTQQP